MFRLIGQLIGADRSDRAEAKRLFEAYRNDKHFNNDLVMIHRPELWDAIKAGPPKIQMHLLLVALRCAVDERPRLTSGYAGYNMVHLVKMLLDQHLPWEEAGLLELLETAIAVPTLIGTNQRLYGVCDPYFASNEYSI